MKNWRLKKTQEKTHTIFGIINEKYEPNGSKNIHPCWQPLMHATTGITEPQKNKWQLLLVWVLLHWCELHLEMLLQVKIVFYAKGVVSHLHSHFWSIVISTPLLDKVLASYRFYRIQIDRNSKIFIIKFIKPGAFIYCIEMLSNRLERIKCKSVIEQNIYFMNL